MRKLQLSFIFLASICLLAGCSTGIPGSGISKTETRTVAEFQSISSSTVGNVSVKVGEPQRVSITFDDNLIDLVETQVVAGELRISTTSSFNSKIGLNVEIVVPAIESCRLSGVGSMVVSGIESENFVAKVSGVGGITASGLAKNVELQLSGVGKADLENLQAISVKAKVSGVGSATVHALESIEATTSGVGSIKVLGQPGDQQLKSTGIGKISILD